MLVNCKQIEYFIYSGSVTLTFMNQRVGQVLTNKASSVYRWNSFALILELNHPTTLPPPVRQNNLNIFHLKMQRITKLLPSFTTKLAAIVCYFCSHSQMTFVAFPYENLDISNLLKLSHILNRQLNDYPVTVFTPIPGHVYKRVTFSTKF